MKTNCGVYISITPDGKLKRDLAAISGKVSFQDTTVEDGYLRMQELTQVFEAGDGLTSQYYFRSISDYYYFLLVHFISRKPNVALCECCGRYFIPATKRKTLYCDREGKTCKELAPSLKHKLDARRRKVIEEFDRAKRRMYKRYERAGDLGKKPSSKDLSYSEYYEWLERATDARDRYLAGEFSEEKALGIIGMK